MAAYCETGEVREMIKGDALDNLIGNEDIDDDQEREEKMLPIIEAAIADASAEIDGYIAKRYDLPLPSVPKVVNKFAKDMALYNIYSRRGIEKDSPQANYLTRYNAAVKFFLLVAEGKVELGVGDVQSAASSGFAVSSNRRMFSRGSLRGM